MSEEIKNRISAKDLIEAISRLPDPKAYEFPFKAIRVNNSYYCDSFYEGGENLVSSCVTDLHFKKSNDGSEWFLVGGLEL